ncbi:MAG TPA: thiamine phosphate synthase [Edaphobacter sp.]|nr:thiamine phosphate synthase [Edaphobacter sp.]
MSFPRLYPLIDPSVLRARGISIAAYAQLLRAAGVQLVQYRDKNAQSQDILRNAKVIAEAFAGTDCRLIMNDRADLAVLAGFGGVHVGQDDLSPEDARHMVGLERWVGVSTHNDEQVRLADISCTDYVAIGPVFATSTKRNAEPVVGLEGVRRARALTSRPLVAIGGITVENAASVIDAGADSVAVVGALLDLSASPAKMVRRFIEAMPPQR